MRISELIEQLHELPQDWHINATRRGDSLIINEPDTGWHERGHRFGYVFTDGRPPRHLRRR